MISPRVRHYWRSPAVTGRNDRSVTLGNGPSEGGLSRDCRALLPPAARGRASQLPNEHSHVSTAGIPSGVRVVASPLSASHPTVALSASPTRYARPQRPSGYRRPRTALICSGVHSWASAANAAWFRSAWAPWPALGRRACRLQLLTGWAAACGAREEALEAQGRGSRDWGTMLRRVELGSLICAAFRRRGEASGLPLPPGVRGLRRNTRPRPRRWWRQGSCECFMVCDQVRGSRLARLTGRCVRHPLSWSTI